jgi:hypothetical protein
VCQKKLWNEWDSFSSQSEKICAPCESWIGDVGYWLCGGCFERNWKSSSPGPVSSIILVHGV